MDQQTAIALIDKYLTGKASREETEQFFHLLEKDQVFIDHFQVVLEEQYKEGIFETEPNEALRQLIQARVQRAIKGSTPRKESISMFPVRRILVAASLILLAGLGAYFLLRSEGESTKPAVAQTQRSKDIEAPKTARATITLSNGKVIYLDSSADGSLAMVGEVQIVKQADGKVLYSGATKELEYHTLTNPRGSKVIDMTLGDGTRVWLNAGSSLRYPVAFLGKERNVSVTGEAYFEVAHNAAMPFKVHKDAVEVSVLGTHFNVNAYEDEPVVKVTLVQGSVRVSHEKDSGLLQPGEQAQVGASIKFVPGVDTEEVLAWKNGRFSFVNKELSSILRELMRWYDVEVVYEGRMPERYFTADVSREKSLASILKIFEASNIRTRIEGKKLFIKP